VDLRCVATLVFVEEKDGFRGNAELGSMLLKWLGFSQNFTSTLGYYLILVSINLMKILNDDLPLIY